MAEYHVPVMLNEVLDALMVKQGGIYLDGTLGGGGHSSAILSRGGKLIALDRDDDALLEARARFERSGYDGYTIVKSNFKNAGQVLDELKIDKIDGALLDLGISSHQIDEPSRGFSYRFDGALDMRMGRDEALTAYDVVNEYSEQEIANILYTYAEEKFSRKMQIPKSKEEAAFGAILYSLVAAKIKTDFNEAAELIKYIEE